MRWKTKKETPPDGGDLRLRLKFAWKPTEVKGGITVWLERFSIEEIFFQPSSGAPGWWCEKERTTCCWYP